MDPFNMSTLESGLRAVDPPRRYYGRVKWYDMDKGIGFIQELDTATGGVVCDVFVHRSSILNRNVEVSGVKLVTGEVVEFDKLPPQHGKSQPQARRVTGFLGGPLICDFGKVEMTQYTYFHSRQLVPVAEVANALEKPKLTRTHAILWGDYAGDDGKNDDEGGDGGADGADSDDSSYARAREEAPVGTAIYGRPAE